MANQPRQAPKVPAPKTQLRLSISSVLENDPKLADVMKITKRQELIARLNERFTNEIDTTESVDNLIVVGAMIEHSVEAGIIDKGGVEEFVRSNTHYTVSYVRMGRRFFNRKDDIPKATKLYRENDDPVKRIKTGFRFKVAQATGIVLVRDALKFSDAYHEAFAGDEIAALKAVDEKYPVDVRRRPQPGEVLTGNKRRLLLETVAIHALVALAKTNSDAPILSYWDDPRAFLEWANNHNYSGADDAAQLAAHRIPKMPWKSVDALHILTFKLVAPPSDNNKDADDEGHPPNPTEGEAATRAFAASDARSVGLRRDQVDITHIGKGRFQWKLKDVSVGVIVDADDAKGETEKADDQGPEPPAQGQP